VRGRDGGPSQKEAANGGLGLDSSKMLRLFEASSAPSISGIMYFASFGEGECAHRLIDGVVQINAPIDMIGGDWRELLSLLGDFSRSWGSATRRQAPVAFAPKLAICRTHANFALVGKPT
jgi:hypothetical protein